MSRKTETHSSVDRRFYQWDGIKAEDVLSPSVRFP
jgi:hypothetical protein